jgi:hypothetical protein
MGTRIGLSHGISGKITLYSIGFVIATSFALVLAQIKPFTVDEWRLIYNLKFKSPSMLWGHLDFVQQFPRAYLELIKFFSSPFDYSYFTLRFPSFLTGILSIALCYRLMKKLFPASDIYRYLFLLILVSSNAFLQYFIQVKQYTMDIFLSLVAIWQLLQLFSINTTATPSIGSYLFLCISFLLAPFFSYTYPIVIAPVFLIAAYRSWNIIQIKNSSTIRYLFFTWLPLFICGLSITIFYFTEVKDVMADKGMHSYWSGIMMQDGFNARVFVTGIYRLFAQVGSGLVFETIFGIIGLLAITFTIRAHNKRFNWDLINIMRLYSLTIILIVIVLFIWGKLPLGEARLNAFTVPAIAFLIVDYIKSLKRFFYTHKWASLLAALLYSGSCGHIFISVTSGFLNKDYTEKLNIYVNTENAIILAESKKIPILITPRIAYPDSKVLKFRNDPELSINLCYPPDFNGTPHCLSANNMPGDWVLKTFPAYKPDEHLAVYAINSLDKLDECLKQLPSTIKTAIVGDGISFRIINK